MQTSASVFADTVDDAPSSAIPAIAWGQRSHPRLARRIEAKPVCHGMPLLPSITSGTERPHTADDIRSLVAACVDSNHWSQWQGLESIAAIVVAGHGHAPHVGLYQIVVREPDRDAVKQTILTRLKDLHAAAADEDMTINPDSERDFRRYILEQMRPSRRPAVTLLENGNLRAFWSDASGQQVGLQFRSDGWVQYVLFARTMPDQTLATSVGRKTFGAALESVRQMGLYGLIYG